VYTVTQQSLNTTGCIHKVNNEVITMKESQVKKEQHKEQRTSTINIRVPPSLKSWIKAKGFSITKIFITACKELGWKTK